jgi:aminomethyltransferase
MTRLSLGEAHYAASCRDDGGILDDVYVFSLAPERALIVVNASNARKMKAWMEEKIAGFNATLVDRHESTAMIAVQGPKALEVLKDIVGEDFVSSLKPRRCGEVEWRGQTLFASRTGYTGEDGLELVVEARAGPDLWRALLDASVVPVGLGGRDTLRLEAALLLYGNDMDEGTNPWECGLGWTVTLDDEAGFIGKHALVGLKERGLTRELVCLKALGRGIMRGGCPVLRDGAEVGNVTSGGYSPTLTMSIGVAYVPPELATEGAELTVDVRGKPLPVQVVPRPFYKRPQAKKA